MVSKPGVLCLEGEWKTDMRDRSSVASLLRLHEGLGYIDCIHRDVATLAELEYYVEKWQKPRYKHYTLGYFAFHGSSGHLHLGKTKSGKEVKVALSELAEMLGTSCQDKIIHFGSCETLRVNADALVEFRKKTNAKAVCGYTKKVDWLESAAFETLLIYELTQSTYLKAVATRIERNYPDLAKRLGFVISMAR